MPKWSCNVKTPLNLQLVENAHLIQFDHAFAISGLARLHRSIFDNYRQYAGPIIVSENEPS